MSCFSIYLSSNKFSFFCWYIFSSFISVLSFSSLSSSSFLSISIESTFDLFFKLFIVLIKGLVLLFNICSFLSDEIFSKLLSLRNFISLISFLFENSSNISSSFSASFRVSLSSSISSSFSCINLLNSFFSSFISSLFIS